MKLTRKSLFRFARILVSVMGCFSLLLCILAFTTIPFDARHWLGTHKGCIGSAPATIVLLGGSGMPSEDGLIRSYYTAMLANKYPLSSVIIALPGDTTDSLSSPSLLRKELIMRGIHISRISFENTGRNTRQQAMQIGSNRKPLPDGTVALVTSPEHMYRSILSFEKVGFKEVKGFPTFENSIEEDKLYFNDHDLKGNQHIPPIGHNKQLRYQFWNHLKYEILVMRELFALTYYKLRSWI